MAAGIPSVVAKGSDLSEIAEEETVLWFEPAKVDALIAGMKALAMDELIRTHMERAGRARAESLFCIDKTVAQVEDIYQEILS